MPRISSRPNMLELRTLKNRQGAFDFNALRRVPVSRASSNLDVQLARFRNQWWFQIDESSISFNEITERGAAECSVGIFQPWELSGSSRSTKPIFLGSPTGNDYTGQLFYKVESISSGLSGLLNQYLPITQYESYSIVASRPYQSASAYLTFNFYLKDAQNQNYLLLGSKSVRLSAYYDYEPGNGGPGNGSPPSNRVPD